MAGEALFTRAGIADPFPHYRELLSSSSHHRGPEGALLLARYDEVSALLRDPRFGHADAPLPADASEVDRLRRRMFIVRNPPDHTRLRGMVNRAFTPRTVQRLEPVIVATVDLLLDDLEDDLGAGDEADLLERFAAPLPVAIIAEMLGVPEADRGAFRSWSEDLVTPVDGGPEALERDRRSGAAFAAYVRDLIDERRARPQDDLVSGLVHAADEDPDVTTDDVVATCLLLLFAGHETTVNLIGNGVAALLGDPDQLARLRDEPTLARSAVEELLRYDGPVHLTARVALEPANVNGTDVAAGERVVLLLGAANRDPRRFERPDQLDVARADNQHLAFGLGIHFCLGAPLARLEGQVAIPALLGRFPDLALADAELTWRPSLMLRGLETLPVRTR